MRSTIERKMVETTITAFSVRIRDGTPEIEPLDPVTVYGRVHPENAVKAVKKKYPEKSGITVSKIESKEVRFTISVEDFVKYATKIEPEETTTTK